MVPLLVGTQHLVVDRQAGVGVDGEPSEGAAEQELGGHPERVGAQPVAEARFRQRDAEPGAHRGASALIEEPNLGPERHIAEVGHGAVVGIALGHDPADPLQVDLDVEVTLVQFDIPRVALLSSLIDELLQMVDLCRTLFAQDEPAQPRGLNFEDALGGPRFVVVCLDLRPCEPVNVRAVRHIAFAGLRAKPDPLGARRGHSHRPRSPSRCAHL